MDRSALKYAAATRAFPGETVNGDRWLVQPSANGMTVLVVDGLGHGIAAAEAADAAIAAVRDRSDLTPAQLIHVCDQALRGTRGAAASALRIAGDRAVFAGIGNVEARIISEGHQTERRWSPDRGIVGRRTRDAHELEFPLSGDWTVLVHTDGISARFEASELGADLSAESIAQRVLSTSRPRAATDREESDPTTTSAPRSVHRTLG